MSSYCCFWCPSKDLQPHELSDTCPSCHRTYDFVLKKFPKTINGYSITESVSRGFYGVVYRAMQESLGRVVVLKVVPVEVYKCFGKDWQKETKEHAAIAAGTSFLADITHQFDALVSFGSEALLCHVAVLDNIQGPTLEDVLKDPAKHYLTARKAAQIATDLFEILHVFLQRNKSHNDLHPGNVIIKKLMPEERRSDAVEPNIRAVAIDFGSMLDLSQSGDDHHVGDQHNIAQTIASLSAAVRKHAAGETDNDYRIAMALRGLAEHLAPNATATRIMSIEDAKNSITASMRAADEPWRQPLYLKRYADTYNAQALQFWHVPDLWIDPKGRWLKGTTVRGPQVITGMRGCGKTMLLRALHFHARVSQGSAVSDAEGALRQLDNDTFVGIYASCQKLLNPQNYGQDPRAPIVLPFERLFIAYLRDSVQVLRHLRSLDRAALSRSIDILLRPALKVFEVRQSETGQIGDELAFDNFLMELEFDLADGEIGCRLKTSPTAAFGHLADVLKRATPRLNQKYVLFLLDDVSTRFLTAGMVGDVVSQLLFQHPDCAFRITTEAQTLQRVLLSPGGTAPADSNRDYQVFDLGNEVYRLLEDGSTIQNMEFIAQILRQRGKAFEETVYRIDPKELLGDVPLEEIAEDIAASSATSPERKGVYRGLRALQAVCVGDIGDVVKLYEKILDRADPNDMPVPAVKQTDAFLEHSANLIHILNRRDQKKKKLALAFAQAAGELLTLSGKQSHGRLRQYTKLYVRVEAGADSDLVAEKLLELLDAGVFVYAGGVPRTKTRDYDPVLQFKLSYKKILGLASFIGLADRDRFELSGDALRRWLGAPRGAHKILVESEAKVPLKKTRTQRPVRNRRTENDSSDQSQQSIRDSKNVAGHRRIRKRKTPLIQYSLQYFKKPPDILDSGVPTLGIRAAATSLKAIKERVVDAVILALGFEERTLVSTKRLLETTKPRQIILVRYDDRQGRDILDLVQRKGIDSVIVSNVDDLQNVLPGITNPVIDSSGLSKPYIFVALREALKSRQRVTVVHTLAKSYYPSNDELQAMGIKPGKEVPSEAFSKLDKILFGEIGPYEMIQIHHEVASPERWRALLASASPKNDRLLHILDSRDYDAARILVPPPTTARRSFARAAAEFSTSVAYENVALVEVDTNDIVSAIQKTEEIYQELYFLSGANIEIGLTGSKIHVAAFAALAAAARISAAWYVRPKRYDPERFTTGVGQTQCFDIWLSDSKEP